MAARPRFPPNSRHHAENLASNAAYTVWDAVRKNDLPGLKSLVADGNSADARNDVGATPLHIAAERGMAGIVAQLLAARASPSAACQVSLTLGSRRPCDVLCKMCAVSPD